LHDSLLSSSSVKPGVHNGDADKNKIVPSAAGRIPSTEPAEIAGGHSFFCWMTFMVKVFSSVV
jgi:hypothetical protein